MSAHLDMSDLQGNILRGYTRKRVRHFLLEIKEKKAARKWLGRSISRDATSGVKITREEQWEFKPDACFNICFTVDGLRAIGVPERSIETFPPEFVEGMIANAKKLGDTGESAPEAWDTPFDSPQRLHILASARADTMEALDAVEKQIVDGGDGAAFNLLGTREGRAFDENKVHFGYRDSISQPRFEGVHDRSQTDDGQPLAPLGTVLLGADTQYEEIRWSVPQPNALGMYGSFNAFRVLEQDVVAFEKYLDQAATSLLDGEHADELLPHGEERRFSNKMTRHGAMREVVAAKLLGRWRNGIPLQLSPDTQFPEKETSLTDFDYDRKSACPYGAHIRRSNPRGGPIVQRSANHTRRLVRRGMPYGEPYDPENPTEEKRGLLGNFICANLAAQFEAVMCDWVNVGLQDPNITGSNDPILGANDQTTSWFEINLPSGGVVRLQGFPRFVNTKGGAYTFFPSIPAIQYMADLDD